MRISYSWLCDFVGKTHTAAEIADRLSVSGLEVEHLEKADSIPGGMRGFVIGHVLTCEKHPNADKLHVTTVDIGTGEAQPIVCGAPNVAAGQKVIVALPGTEVTVPGKGIFTIGEAKIRGEISRGMICADDECGLEPPTTESGYYPPMHLQVCLPPSISRLFPILFSTSGSPQTAVMLPRISA
jgi:phenylalanyl-tRNA synthetase beta chain